MKVGQTEVVDNNLNPKWIDHFKVDYYFERMQTTLWEVYDFDDDNDFELIGSAEVLLSDILRAPKSTYQATLVNDGKHSGTLKVKADVLNVSGDTIKIHC